MAPRHVAVVDIGKTNAKLALVDVAAHAEVAVVTMANRVVADGPYPHFDEAALRDFCLSGLAGFHRDHGIDAISITTHGATAALIGDDGALALPVLDYEHDGPEETRDAYDRIRPPFAESGTPKLPQGLNLGAQLFWQERAFPQAFARTKLILPYPQYWAFRLTGVAAGEATSLGCHTDLWAPRRRDWSSMVDGLGWRGKMPPLRSAFDVLGPVEPGLAARLGLPAGLPVHCGLHDSNASLLPHLVTRRPPFTVVSTGTWVIVLAVGAEGGDAGGGIPDGLDPARDTLVNVNALGDPVASARFMGGREFSNAMGESAAVATSEDLARVLGAGVMVLPSLQPGCGPYPQRPGGWSHPPETLGPGTRAAALSLYLALMTATCRDLVHGDGPTVVEGPFARNAVFLAMLAAVTGRAVVAGGASATGTSFGAALLAAGPGASETHPAEDPPRPPDPALLAYAARWRAAVAGDQPAVAVSSSSGAAP
ncbi:FGGY-family carbohydrate kinase [Methylobrevis pamukkalensis]